MTWQQIKAIILLPFTVLVVIPAIILYFTGVGGTALRQPAPWNVLMLVGTAVFLVVGLMLLVTTVALFAKVGRGTLAPWNPPQHLVVEGPYRYVRNPISRASSSSSWPRRCFSDRSRSWACSRLLLW